MLRRLVGQHQQRDLPGPVGLLRPGDPAAAQLRQQPGHRWHAADQGAHRLPHLLAAGALAVRLHHRQHDRQPERRRAGTRSRRSASRWRRTATRRSRRATSTSPTGRSSTGCGRRTASSPTPSRCTRARAARAAASTRRTSRSCRRPPATGRRCCCFGEYADCVYRVIGKQAQYCGGGGGGTTVYFDNFETATGWTTNPSGTDTATTGAWERGDPAADQLVRCRSSSAPRSAAPTTWSPARPPARAPATFDIDGGVDQHPLAGDHAAVDRDADALASRSTSPTAATRRRRTSSGSSIVHNGGTTAVFTRSGAAVDLDAVWTSASASLTPYAGQSIRILIEAADASGASLVEAAVDDVRIMQN